MDQGSTGPAGHRPGLRWGSTLMCALTVSKCSNQSSVADCQGDVHIIQPSVMCSVFNNAHTVSFSSHHHCPASAKVCCSLRPTSPPNPHTRRSLPAGVRTVDSLYKLKIFIQIAMLYLEDEDPVSAETYIKKASSLIAGAKDPELELQYKTSYARIMDAKRRCE